MAGIFDYFKKSDIRVGTIVSAKKFEKARKPAYQLEVLVLGAYSDGGVLLITPEKKVKNGGKLG